MYKLRYDKIVNKYEYRSQATKAIIYSITKNAADEMLMKQGDELKYIQVYIICIIGHCFVATI